MKRILVIDDEENMRRLVANALRSQGYDILDAANGEDGVRLARAELPDLVVSDVNMPGTDGFAVLKALRVESSTSAIPVILMTGAAQPTGLRQGMDDGADDYLAKPFVLRDLFATVRARLERRETVQAQAKANEARLLDLLRASQDLIGIADAAEERLMFLNEAGRKMLGLQSEDDASKLTLSDFQSERRENVEEAKRNGIWVGETEFVNREGRSIRVSMQILAHRLLDGNPGHLSIVARDVTELKAAQRERQLMEVQLRQSQKIEAIGQLAAGIAHEINTPIQYVGDNIQFLQESFSALQRVLENREQLIGAAKAGLLTPKFIAQAEEMTIALDLDYLSGQIPAAITQTIEGISRITKIVRAMKEFSHPGGQEKTAADLNHAIETTITVARNEWKYVAEVKTDFDPTLPTVPCYIGEFNQAILNLIVNAAHAIGDVVKDRPGTKGLITVRTRRLEEDVEVRVSDTGAGIPKAIQSRIFEPFFTTKPVGKGTGQGLAVVYSNIVKKHGGSVRFESEASKGSTFILSLPLSPPAQSPGVLAAAAPEAAPL